MGRYAKNPELTQGSAVEIPSVSTAQRPSGSNGQIIYNTTTSTYQVYNGTLSTDWHNISEASREKTITIDKFQGDGTTTTFGAGAPSGSMLGGSGNDAAFSQTVNDATDIIVFIGGVYQIPTTNYSVSGQQITFGDAPSANDGSTGGHIITIIHGLQKLGE